MTIWSICSSVGYITIINIHNSYCIIPLQIIYCTCRNVMFLTRISIVFWGKIIIITKFRFWTWGNVFHQYLSDKVVILSKISPSWHLDWSQQYYLTVTKVSSGYCSSHYQFAYCRQNTLEFWYHWHAICFLHVIDSFVKIWNTMDTFSNIFVQENREPYLCTWSPSPPWADFKQKASQGKKIRFLWSQDIYLSKKMVCSSTVILAKTLSLEPVGD